VINLPVGFPLFVIVNENSDGELLIYSRHLTKLKMLQIVNDEIV